MAKPKQMWFVEVKIGDAKPADVGWRWKPTRLGGKFSSREAAMTRKKSVLYYWPDATVKVFGSGLINWTEIS